MNDSNFENFQSSVTIGGSNQIVKGPDERDEIPPAQQVVMKDAIDPVISVVPPAEVEEKSERVLRHAIQSRTDEQSEDDDDDDDIKEDVPSTNAPNIDNTETTTMRFSEKETTVTTTTTPSLTMPQTEGVSTETEEVSSKTEATTTMIPESTSTISNKEDHHTTSPTPEWMGLGYYESGIHKPEFIESVEFTTNHPSSSSELVGEENRYIEYASPFKPSLPDYNSNAYSSNFFVPLLRYFKR